MRLGVSATIHDVTLKLSWSDLLKEYRRLAQLADRQGFDTFWLDEHHFSIEGRSFVPNPILLAADLAAHTERIRIGLSAVIITQWHPLRLAEDLSMLDHISGGRIEIGVGRGNFRLELLNLNPIADSQDQNQNLEVFEETYKIAQMAMTQEKFAFKGKHYTFPKPGFSTERTRFIENPAYIDPKTGELAKLSVFPRAFQKDLPPFWMVVNSIESIQHAARLDSGIIMWRPGIKSLQQRVRAYKDALEQALGRNVLDVGDRTAIMRDTFCARTEKEALDKAGDLMMATFNFSNWRGPSIYLDPGETLSSEEEARLREKLPYDFVRDRCVWFGGPERIYDKIVELKEETGIGNVHFKSSWLGLDYDSTYGSIEMIGKEVLPAIRAKYGTVKAPAA